MDNYELSRNRAQQYFLGFDQEKILRSWPLRHDEAFIYLDSPETVTVSALCGEITDPRKFF